MRFLKVLVGGILAYLLAEAIVRRRKNEKPLNNETASKPKGNHRRALSQPDHLSGQQATLTTQLVREPGRQRRLRVLTAAVFLGFLALSGIATWLALSQFPDRPLLPAPDSVVMSISSFRESADGSKSIAVQPTDVHATLAEQTTPNTWRITVAVNTSVPASSVTDPDAGISLELFGPFRPAACEPPPRPTNRRVTAGQLSTFCSDLAAVGEGSSGSSVDALRAETKWRRFHNTNLSAKFIFSVAAPPGTLGFVTDGLSAKASYPRIVLNNGTLTPGEVKLTLGALPSWESWEWRDIPPDYDLNWNTFTWKKPEQVELIEGTNRETLASDQRALFISGVAAGVAGGAVLAVLQSLASILGDRHRI